MAYDIAHVCVADLDWVMIPCVYVYVKIYKSIRTCVLRISAMFVITIGSRVRLWHEAS